MEWFVAPEAAGQRLDHHLQAALPEYSIVDDVTSIPPGLRGLHPMNPVNLPRRAGVQLDRRCGSGLAAICFAAMEVQTGTSDVVLAGGVESMSNVEHYATGLRTGARGNLTLYDRLDRGRLTAGSQNYLIQGGMLETAENLRKQYGIPRQAQDEYSLRSHQRAVSGWDAGKFDEELVPVTVTTRQGEVTVDRDEHPRADTSLERLGQLRAVMGRQDPEATVTAGNASGENDAAAVNRVTAAERCGPGEAARRAALAAYSRSLDALAGRLAEYRP